MDNQDYNLINEAIFMQEELLQFDSFSASDAWALGRLMAEEIERSQMEMAVCIRKLNGNIIFQYATEKTNLNHENWMRRKFNTVSLMERSSLGALVALKIMNRTMAFHGLDEREYAFCGGGYPVRVRGAGIVAVITVSYLPHVKDHDFIVTCLTKYLNAKGVPASDWDIPT